VAEVGEVLRPTVLQVLGPSAGGIRRHVAELVRQVESLGWRSVVAGPTGVMDGIGRQDVVLSDVSGWPVTGLLRVRRRLRHHVRTADLLHVHGIKAAAVVSSIRGRAPMVVTLHNDMVGTHVGIHAQVRRLVQHLLLRRAEHVIFVSAAGAAANRRTAGDARSSVIMSFSARPVASADRATLRSRLDLPADGPLVAVVARLHPQKDLAMFLRAFAVVRRSVPQARALVAGDGPQRAELEGLRDALGLSGAVHFVGATDAAADLIAAADVFAISSRWEAGPITAVEAMQLGTPVVMTDTGSIAETAGPRGAVRVVPVGDTEAFAAALVSLLADPDARAELADRGRALAEGQYDPSVLVHCVDAVYRRQFDGERHRRPVSTRDAHVASTSPQGTRS
jgi:glycosyltransferase involved in cell wall biosynthesis